jgi:hypothetical protein
MSLLLNARRKSSPSSEECRVMLYGLILTLREETIQLGLLKLKGNTIIFLCSWEESKTIHLGLTHIDSMLGRLS